MKLTIKKLLVLTTWMLLKTGVMAQTDIGTGSNTKLSVFEYYNHTTPEWVKLFRIKNYNADLGFWGKGGVSGRVYFVDYQGQGGSYIDFSFPQSITNSTKPVLIFNGSSATKLEWNVYSGSHGPGQDYYDVYVKTPAHHLGLTFLIRGRDYDPLFFASNQPATGLIWNYQLSPESFNFYSGNGNLGLGINNPQERLAVNGKIRAKEIKVEMANWPDYVFENDYKIISLQELEKYIKEKKHLPEMPTAKEVEAGGVELGEMNKLMLKKIEELTLYLIEKDRQLLDALNRISELEKKRQ